MVSEVSESQVATEAELAAAAQQAVESYQRNEARGTVAGSQELGALKPMQYRVAAQDQATWVLVWELKVDRNGMEYGIPRQAPRQQLGLWLQKRREYDGGIRFVATQPSRIAAETQYPCIHPECPKKLGTRTQLVRHVRGLHPDTAAMYEELLNNMMASASKDNPAVARLLESMANMKEPGVESVAVGAIEPRQEKLDLTAGAPVVTKMGITKADGCAACDWKFKESWSEAQSNQFLMAHTRSAHKEELE